MRFEICFSIITRERLELGGKFPRENFVRKSSLSFLPCGLPVSHIIGIRRIQCTTKDEHAAGYIYVYTRRMLTSAIRCQKVSKRKEKLVPLHLKLYSIKSR